MAEDNTGQIYRTDDEAGGAKRVGHSKIFNTSIRGWGLIIGMSALAIAMLAIVFAPFFTDVGVSETVAGLVIGAFISNSTLIVKSYYDSKSQEGQTHEPKPKE